MSEQVQLTTNQRQSPSNDKGYSVFFRDNLHVHVPLWHTVSLIDNNCTHSAEHEGIPQGFHPFGIGQSLWRREYMAGTHNTTLSCKEFFSHNAVLSWATGDDHSLDTTFPRIPDLIYHQNDEWRHKDGTTSLPTTNQNVLVVKQERKYPKAVTLFTQTILNRLLIGFYKSD